MAWLASHSFRKEITIQDTNVDGNLTDFPCYVDITADADFHESLATGYDIRFTDSGGQTLLKYEREYWTGGNGSAATGHFWVKVPSILATGGATIYCYYGDADASDGEDAANVWDANYMAVWHLDEASGGPYNDSSGNGHNSTGGTMPDQVAGKFHMAQDFEVASSEYINFGNVCNLSTNDFTISAWINPDIAASLDYIGKRVNDEGYRIAHSSSDGYSGVEDTDTDWISTDTTGDLASTANWHYMVTTGDKSEADGLKLYVDNAQNVGREGNLTGIGDIDSTESLAIGARSGSSPGNYFDGIIQEVRISNTLRSVAWIGFEYANMNEGDNELTWAAEESSGYTLVCDAGSYAITGTAMTPLHDKKVAVDSGSYAITGTAMSPLHDKKLSCAAGSYIIAGQAVSLVYSGGAVVAYGKGWHMFQRMSQN